MNIILNQACVFALLSISAGLAQANQASREIKDFAVDICGNTVDTKSSANSIEVGVSLDTKLGALLGKLGDLSVGGSAKLKEERTSGLLQKDLGNERASQRDCKYKVFDRLTGGLNIFSPTIREFKRKFTVDLPL